MFSYFLSLSSPIPREYLRRSGFGSESKSRRERESKIDFVSDQISRQIRRISLNDGTRCERWQDGQKEMPLSPPTNDDDQWYCL